MSDPAAGSSKQLVTAGTPLAEARRAMVLLHGRGATAEDILSLAAHELSFPEVAYVAPQAPGYTWYPESFLAPLERNEPYLGRSLQTVREALDLVSRSVPLEHVTLLGFSQGACLGLEFVARNAPRLGFVAGFSGGLIGPPGAPREYPGDLQGVRAFIGCGNLDPHIPVTRVRETEEALSRMGARVDARIYPGMGHAINEDEIEAVRQGVMRV